jgi:putative FmdB family regulatory protein
MPIYEYECSQHGVFEELRPMQRSAEGAECPTCQALARRVLSATRTSLVPRAVSTAIGRNEKSQHAPEVSTRGHHHPPHPKPSRPGQAQVYRGPRPWVMEHG